MKQNLRTYHILSRILCLGLIITCISIPQTLEAQNSGRRGKKFRSNGRSFRHEKREKKAQNVNCSSSPYRSYDGTCNNVNSVDKTEWGATDMPFRRVMPAAYGDKMNKMAGLNRPNPRSISNILMDQSTNIPSERDLSSFVFSWGQFLDHDIDLTPEGEDSQPIPMPDEETIMGLPIPFNRSAVMEGTGESVPREQINLITSWIDASNVYGSDEVRANWLRTFQDGKLKTSAGNLLPFNTTDGEYSSPIDMNAPSMAGDADGHVKVFVAGDVRANEQPGLTSLHTLFVREHNQICEQLKASGWRNDEQMYQMARKIVGGYIQAITYQEFLPAMGIQLNGYKRYDPKVKPNVSNLFATAAYRLGHSMVPDELLLLSDNCENVGEGSLSLMEGFFNPSHIQSYGIDPFLKGFSVQKQQEIDLKIIDNLRNFLFARPGAGHVFGLDLAALNIQRGRDHGLPSYQEIRKHFQGKSAKRFRDLTKNRELTKLLKEVYGRRGFKDIDVWVGLLAEDHAKDASVGPTLALIMQDQFERLRDGDYFYYENDPFFSLQQIYRIKQTQLSDIIRRNTELNDLQSNVFYAGPRCETLANAGTGRIGNYVWEDEDRDGKQDGDEEGVEDVLVTLKSCAGKVVATTRTDDDGKYEFRNLPQGLYYLVFTDLPEGTELTRANAHHAAENKDSDPYGQYGNRTRCFALYDGKRNYDIDAGIRKASDQTGFDIISSRLDLLNFKAETQEGRKVLLTWEAKGGFNADFILEKSIDAFNFQAIDQIGASQDGKQQTYTSLDEREMATVNYYRLKQADPNGQFFYSEVVIANFENDLLVEVYPNPVENQLYLGLQAGKDASWEVEIFDLAGRSVYKEAMALKEGKNDKVIEAAKWPQGTYMIRVSNTNTRYTQRFVKQ